jgi:hypothetical protein
MWIVISHTISLHLQRIMHPKKYLDKHWKYQHAIPAKSIYFHIFKASSKLSFSYCVFNILFICLWDFKNIFTFSMFLCKLKCFAFNQLHLYITFGLFSFCYHHGSDGDNMGVKHSLHYIKANHNYKGRATFPSFILQATQGKT